MSACLVLLGVLLGCTGGAAAEAGRTATVDPPPHAALEADAAALARTPLVTSRSATPRLAAPGVATPTPPQDPADSWVGEDKLRHLGVSFAATSFAFGLARLALDPGPAMAAAGAATIAAGVIKEVQDRRAGGPFSVRDLLWDAAGIAAALALADRIR